MIHPVGQIGWTREIQLTVQNQIWVVYLHFSLADHPTVILKSPCTHFPVHTITNSVLHFSRLNTHSLGYVLKSDPQTGEWTRGQMPLPEHSTEEEKSLDL